MRVMRITQTDTAGGRLRGGGPAAGSGREQGLEVRGALRFQERAAEQGLALRSCLHAPGQRAPGGRAEALAAGLDRELLLERSPREELPVDRVELRVLGEEVPLHRVGRGAERL